MRSLSFLVVLLSPLAAQGRVALPDVLEPNAEAPSEETRVASRVREGLLVLYRFEKPERGHMIRDVSEIDDDPLDLLIRAPDAVVWAADGLRVFAPVVIQSGRNAERIRREVGSSNEITIEAWITPATTKTTQSPGPMRVVSLSGDTCQRSFTLGQQDDSYDVRLRSTEVTNRNGLPSTRSLCGSVTLAPTHVVFTRDATGVANLYLDGRPFSRAHVGGELSWPEEYPLLLANEKTGDRPWFGTFHLVAVYRRALAPLDVRWNFEAGY